MENIGTALQISVIGMGLVFGSIILLWGVMSALVRLTADRTPVQAEPDHREAEYELKRRAAAAAVTVALAQEDEGLPHLFPLPQTATISAWQAARRANQLEQRGSHR